MRRIELRGRCFALMIAGVAAFAWLSGCGVHRVAEKVSDNEGRARGGDKSHPLTIHRQGIEKGSDDEAQASVEDNGLRLTVKLTSDCIRTGGTTGLFAELENVSDRRILLFKPFFGDVIDRTNWRIKDSSGNEVYIYARPVQVHIGAGMRGKVVALPPKGRFSFSTPLQLVTATKQVMIGDPDPLKPGVYSIACSYREDGLVPFLPTPLHVGGKFELHPVAGLWTGSLQPPELVLTVRDTGDLHLTIDLPQVTRRGEPYPLEIELMNFGDTSRKLRGAFELKLSPPPGSAPCRARFSVGSRTEIIGKKSSYDIEIPAQSKIRYTVDLKLLNFGTLYGTKGERLQFDRAARLGVPVRYSLVYKYESDLEMLPSNDLVRTVHEWN